MNRTIAGILNTLVVLAIGTSVARAELSVRTDFENASAEVIAVHQESGLIQMRPAGDPKRGWPCWWSFQVDGIEPGRTLTIEVDRAPGNLSASWAQPGYASYSIDGGKTWLQTEKGVAKDGRKSYAARINAKSAWFAWGPVFDVGDAHELVDRLAAEHRYVTKFELAKSRAGRGVPAIVVDEKSADVDDSSRFGLWIQARQHAWESGGSWVGVGFIDWLTSDDPRAAALRKRAIITFVPVMDVDSVATGNGGKNQVPQDHNRDWSAAPHFPEVAAAQKRIAELDKAGRFDLFVDLHNPAPGDLRPFFFVSPDEELSPTGRRNLATFVAAAKGEIVGPLVLSPNTKPSGANYSPQWQAISKNWVTMNCRPHVVAVTLETSWNTEHGTTAGYTTVGRQLGLAIEKYLRESPRSAAGE
jgi:hypothetical protein